MTERKERKIEKPDRVRMGIDVDQIISANDESDITKDQVMEFIDKYIELVGSFGWSSGGGFTLLDINEDSHVFSLAGWVIADHVERINNGEEMPAIIWPDKALDDDIPVLVTAERRKVRA